MSPMEEKKLDEIREIYPTKTDGEILLTLFKDLNNARAAAFLYYEDAVTIRAALHERLNHNPKEFAIFDSVIAAAKDVFAFRDKNMHSEVEAERAEEVRKIIEAAVAETLEKRNGKPKKKAAKKQPAKKQAKKNRKSK